MPATGRWLCVMHNAKRRNLYILRQQIELITLKNDEEREKHHRRNYEKKNSESEKSFPVIVRSAHPFPHTYTHQRTMAGQSMVVLLIFV
jgi:hypothetical protein